MTRRTLSYSAAVVGAVGLTVHAGLFGASAWGVLLGAVGLVSLGRWGR